MANLLSTLTKQIKRRNGKPRGFVRVEFKTPQDAAAAAAALRTPHAYLSESPRVLVVNFGTWLVEKTGAKMPGDMRGPYHPSQPRGTLAGRRLLTAANALKDAWKK